MTSERTRRFEARPRDAAYEPDLPRTIDLVMRPTAIRGRSGQKSDVAAFIERQFHIHTAGAPTAAT